MGEQSVKELYQKQIQEAENKKELVENEIEDLKKKCRILRDNIRRIRTELLTETDIGKVIQKGTSTAQIAEVMQEMTFSAGNAEHE